MRRCTPALFVLVVAAIAGGSTASGQAREGLVDRLFAQYAAGDTRAAIAGVTGRNYDSFRRQLEASLGRWSHARTPLQGAFLIEVVQAGIEDSQTWAALDVLHKARAFVMSRPDPPGRSPAADAAEIAWHKTVGALLEGLWSPDLVNDEAVAPLRKRMTSRLAPAGPPSLVDPWIDLTDGIVAEQRTAADPRTLSKYGPVAIERFDKAAEFEPVRAEAVVRKACVLTRLGRHTDALAALDSLNAPIDDQTVRYWAAVVRGRALEGASRNADAERAYGEALAVVPHAQSPLAALAALALRQGDRDAAIRWATDGRSGAAVDPWLRYSLAEARFYRARLAALRAAK